MSENDLKDALIKSLDSVGIELRVWKEDYFGKRSEEELTDRLAQRMFEYLNTKEIKG